MLQKTTAELNGIVVIVNSDTIFILEEVMTNQIIIYIITLVIGGAVGIIGYFVKRTMTKNDLNGEDIQKLKTSTASKSEVEKLRDMVTGMSDKYASKEEVREVKESIKTLTAGVDEIKGNMLPRNEFLTYMVRLEGKVDDLSRERRS